MGYNFEDASSVNLIWSTKEPRGSARLIQKQIALAEAVQLRPQATKHQKAFKALRCRGSVVLILHNTH